MEQAKGHTGNNIVTVLMKAKNLSLQGASDHVGHHYKHLMDDYLKNKTRLPSFGDNKLDEDVRHYVKAMENWPIGNLVSAHTTTSSTFTLLTTELELEF
jgi:hypothetical protein